MSESWTEYGYGVKLSGLNNAATSDGIRKLLAALPKTRDIVADALKELENTDGSCGVELHKATVEDFCYLPLSDKEAENSLHGIMCCAINELIGCEDVMNGIFESSVDEDGETYVVMAPKYPWGFVNDADIYEALKMETLDAFFRVLYQTVTEDKVTADPDFQQIDHSG